MLPALAICMSACASLGFISHLLRNAPVGWEDETGFHAGIQAPRTAMKIRRARYKAPLLTSQRRSAELVSAAIR
jgi:hypothetical protein